MENILQSLLRQDIEDALNRDLRLWELLNNKRIFLSGGTGFIGCWLLETYLAAKKRLNFDGELCLLSRDPELFSRRCPHLANHPGLSLLKGDIRSFPFPSERFDLMIHAAVEYGTPLKTLEHNLLGSMHMFDFARHAGIKRVLFTSSGAVYGPQVLTTLRTDEEAPIESPWLVRAKAYGESKRATELLRCLRGENDGFTFLIARGFAFLGPYLSLKSTGAAGNFIGDALMGRSIRVRGDGTTVRSYLYGCDLAVWLWTILLRGESGRPYNVGSDEAISIGDLARRIRDLVNPALNVEIAQTPNPGNRSDVYVPSINRAKNELGLAVWTGLDAMIMKTARWNVESRQS